MSCGLSRVSTGNRAGISTSFSRRHPGVHTNSTAVAGTTYEQGMFTSYGPEMATLYAYPGCPKPNSCGANAIVDFIQVSIGLRTSGATSNGR